MRNYRTTLTSISTADPAVFTLVDHGLYEGDKIQLQTTGTLPTGLSEDTNYYVIMEGLTTSTFEVASTPKGTPIATTVAGSGTHYFYKMNHDGLSVFQQDTK